MKVNIGCGPHRARSPWINVDRVYLPGDIEPDIVNESGWPADLIGNGHIPERSVSHVYLGHVLEHVPWDDVPTFLRSLLPMMADNGQVCVVGPDVMRAIDGYKAGTVARSLVIACLEGPNPQIDDLASVHDGARHQWNSTEERVMQALTGAGFEFVEACRPRDLDAVWPLVAPPDWQCAVTGKVPW